MEQFGCPVRAQKISISGTTARNTTDFIGTYIAIKSDVDCFIRLGDSTITATADVPSIPLLSDSYYEIEPNDNKRIAAITTGASGTLYIIEFN